MIKNKIKTDRVTERINDSTEGLEIKYFSIKETAKLLRISERSVYALIHNGELIASKKFDKKQWCIFETDLKEFLNKPIPKIQLKKEPTESK